MNKMTVTILVVIVVLAILLGTVVARAVTDKPSIAPQLAGSTIPWAQHEFVVCDSARQLVVGHAVPDGETWTLTSIHAKNNTGSTTEINVAVYFYKIDQWVCLKSAADTGQYQGVAWAGEVELGVRDQLGWWFRGATEGDTLQVDATFTRQAAFEVVGRQAVGWQVLDTPDNETIYLK